MKVVRFSNILTVIANLVAFCAHCNTGRWSGFLSCEYQPYRPRNNEAIGKKRRKKYRCTLENMEVVVRFSNILSVTRHLLAICAHCNIKRWSGFLPCEYHPYRTRNNEVICKKREKILPIPRKPLPARPLSKQCRFLWCFSLNFSIYKATTESMYASIAYIISYGIWSNVRATESYIIASLLNK